MIRVATEFGPDGVTLVKTIDDNEDGTGTVTHYAADRSVTGTETVTIVVPEQLPLDHAGALAALLACLGVVPVDHAANAVGLTPVELEAEVLAWEVAAAEHMP